MQTDTLKNFQALSQIHTDSYQSIPNTPRYKFLLTNEHFNPIVEELPSRYLVLETNGKKVSKYTSIYFDTSNNENYNIENYNLIHKNREELKIIEEGKLYSGINLEDSFSVDFNRIILVNEFLTEKCTIDFNINYKSRDDNFSLGKLVIVEMFNSNQSISYITNWLFSNGIQNSEFSKFTIGKAYCANSRNENRLTEKMPTIKKITQCNDEKWVAMY